jgi:thymidylate synthase (FAD)
MILVKPKFEILKIMGVVDGGFETSSLELIERAGRTCYKSEDKITPESAKEFVQKINKLGHESVLEHSAMTVKFICDRGVSHELVRHRLCAFSQESTRYCNYHKWVTFVIPPWVGIKPGKYEDLLCHTMDSAGYWWASHMLESEKQYMELVAYGWSPQQARSVLPNSTKTEIVVTTNFREWKHIFNLRCSKAAHPQMRELMIPLLDTCVVLVPIIFDDIQY